MSIVSCKYTGLPLEGEGRFDSSGLVPRCNCVILLPMKPLPTVFSLPLPGNIFRVLADPYSEDWCLEVRDATKQEAYWLWIPGGDTAEINTLRIPDSWSCTLMDVAAGELVLGKYEAGGMPVIAELAAWSKDLDSLWHYPNAKEFHRNQEGWVVLENGRPTVEKFRTSRIFLHL